MEEQPTPEPLWCDLKEPFETGALYHRDILWTPFNAASFPESYLQKVISKESMPCLWGERQNCLSIHIVRMIFPWWKASSYAPESPIKTNIFIYFINFSAHILWGLRLDVVWPWTDLSDVSSGHRWKSNMAGRCDFSRNTDLLVSIKQVRFTQFPKFLLPNPPFFLLHHPLPPAERLLLKIQYGVMAAIQIY